jgi:hypothetical protein
VLNVWREPGGVPWEAAKLLDRGDLVVVGVPSGEMREEGKRPFVARFSWEGDTIWRRDMEAHHDVELTPDGRLLVLTLEPRWIPEVSTATRVGDNLLTFLSLDGETLEERSLYEALASNPGELTFQSVHPERIGEEEYINLIHANAVACMPGGELASRHPIYAAGNVLVTARHQDSVCVIDPASNTLLWAWGRGVLAGPHDGQVLENGNFLIFDNGLGRERSRVVEVDPRTKSVVWEYAAPEPPELYTITRGRCQRLPNRNTLVLSSNQGRALEVTPGGETVWEYLNPHYAEPRRRGTISFLRRYEGQLFEDLLAGKGG